MNLGSALIIFSVVVFSDVFGRVFSIFSSDRMRLGKIKIKNKLLILILRSPFTIFVVIKYFPFEYQQIE